MPHDYSGVLPGGIIVYFASGQAVERTIKTASAADAKGGIAEAPYINVAGHPGKKYFSDTLTMHNVLANPTANPPVVGGTNMKLLDALATCIARNYYDWRIIDSEVVVNTTLNPLFEAHHDAVEFTYGLPDGMDVAVATTRFVAATRNIDPEVLSHGEGPKGKDAPCDPRAMPQVIAPPLTRDSKNIIYFNQYALSIVDGELVLCLNGPIAIPAC